MAVAALIGLATPAFAHAELDATTPPDGAVLPASPGRVSMVFGEAVQIPLGSVRVFNSGGQRIDIGSPYHPAHSLIAVAENIPAHLRDGGYVVTWRVISADSHPVHGAFTFQIGSAASASATKAQAARLFSSDRGSSLVGVIYGINRALGYAAVAVLVGGAALVAGAWLEGAANVRVRRLLWGGWWATIITTALTVVLQGPYGAGLALTAAWRVSVISAAVHTRLAEVYLGRLAVVLLAGVLLGVLIDTGWRAGWVPGPADPEEPAVESAEPGEDPGRRVAGPGPAGATGTLVADAVAGSAIGEDRLPAWWAPAAVAAALAILITPGLTDHASTGSLVTLAIVADLVHVAGASVWIGGLALLSVAGLVGGQSRQRKEVLAQVMPRFSVWALASVTALVVSGGFAAWREVGSVHDVTATTYGRLLLAKTIVFAALVSVGATSRWLTRGRVVRRRGAGDVAPGGLPEYQERRRSRVRTATSGELILAAGVFSLTALLVNAQPARQALNEPYTTQVAAGPVLVDLTLDSSRPGPNELHVYTLDRSGSQLPVPELDATFSLPSRGITGIPVKLEVGGPGHFQSFGLDLPLAGSWRLDLRVRTDQIDEYDARPVTLHLR